MIAAVLLAASQHVSMIVIGRVFQGIAVSPVCFRHTHITRGSLAINIMQVKTDQALVDLAPYHFVVDSASVEIAWLKLQSASHVFLLLQISFASVSVPIYNR